jgi:hypothetical protein
VGLAELAVDGMFRAPWFGAVRVTRATADEWLGIEEAQVLPDLKPWTGLTLPIGCLPPSSFTPKLKLLRRGSATFDVCVGGRVKPRKNEPAGSRLEVET